MSQIVNISGYKFVTISDPAPFQAALRDACLQQGLKGTILLSHEGINCFVAGTRTGIDSFLDVIRSMSPFSDFAAKESFSSYQPFSRMLVKIKKEIITFEKRIRSRLGDSRQKLSPTDLKQWLDQEKDLVLLDTRNDYEVELGTFNQAKSVSIDNFREFPEAIENLPKDYKKKTIVMFCTGGIRCEKAGPFMEEAGFENVFQLDGGILKYFETCGDAHWQGECFVFDKRVALDPQLSETGTTMCFNCQALVTEQDQRNKRYQFGVSCPICFEESNEQESIVEQPEQRNLLIAENATPLPGSLPYENFRPMNVSQEMDGLSLLEFLLALRTHILGDQWLQFIEAGVILHKGKPVGLDRRVAHGQKYYHLMPQTTEPDVNAEIRVLHEDQHIVVVEKPAPLPMHPCGRFNKNSLQTILQNVYQPNRLRLVHRLDANTTGIVVYARSKEVATSLQEQFANGKVIKEYLAGVWGHPPQMQFQSDKKIAKQPGQGGIRFLDSSGQTSQTQFEVLDQTENEIGGTSLLKAMPITGRTNQIRLHLWDLGFPIINDSTYLPNLKTGISNQTQSIDEPLLQLHAYCIGFRHPGSGDWIQFSAQPPAWVRSFPSEKPNSRKWHPGFCVF